MDKDLQVFISHNKKDKDVAREISLFLAAEDISIWFDEWEIPFGHSIIEKIREGLDKCTHFVILWSKNTQPSPWVKKELNATLARSIQTNQPVIIPILIDETPLDILLLDLRHLEYEGGTETDRSEIIHAITGRSPSQNFLKAVVKKYHEVISDPDAKDPFGLKCCPFCGSERLKGSTQIDYTHDEAYHFLACEDCGWSDWTQ